MDLKDFVAASLVQIVEGVAEAQKKMIALNALINPPKIQSADKDKSYSAHVMFKLGEPHLLVQEVEFDVAVVAAADSQTKAGAGLIAVVTAGVSKESGSKNESTSRIKFTVPLALPHQPTEAQTPPRQLP